MKIICIGRNYADHAKELKNEIPQEPVFFLKPDSALVTGNKPIYYPDFTTDLQHEIELVIRISRLGKHIDQKFAHKYYSEIGLGIDFTARDIQNQCKAKGLPWEKAKAFDGSAPVSDFFDIESFGKIEHLSFHLENNGGVVQHGNSANMIFSIDHIISYISTYMTLKIGDLIFTGTPAGVGPVKPGDKLTGFIEGKKMLQCSVK